MMVTISQPFTIGYYIQKIPKHSPAPDDSKSTNGETKTSAISSDPFRMAMYATITYYNLYYIRYATVFKLVS
jgi:hypothetical protein